MYIYKNKSSKCREIYHTWMVWVFVGLNDMSAIHQLANCFETPGKFQKTFNTHFHKPIRKVGSLVVRPNRYTVHFGAYRVVSSTSRIGIQLRHETNKQTINDQRQQSYLKS